MELTYFDHIGGTFTMGPEEAVRCARMLRPKQRMLRPKQAVPLHYGTLPALTGDPDTFARLMDEASMTAQVLGSGETLTL